MSRANCLLIRALLAPEITPSLTLTEWDTLIRQARSAQLLARLATLVAEHGLLERVPDKPRQHLVSISRLCDHQRTAVRWEVQHLLEALEQASVPLVLLKGAAYEMAGLPPARCRMFGDFDLLVPKSKLKVVETTLMTHGWSSAHQSPYDQRYYRTWMHELPPLRHISRHSVVDVHHNLVPETGPLSPDPEKILAAAVPCEGHPDIRVLCGNDMILHSAVHLFHDGEFDNALRDLFDLRDLMTQFMHDEKAWSSLADRAITLNLGRPLHYTLRYLQRLLELPVPEHIHARLRPHAPGALGSPLRDAMFERGLMPFHETCSDWLSPVAKFALYVRGHALRMPVHLLLPHLARKALHRSNLLPDNPKGG